MEDKPNKRELSKRVKGKKAESAIVPTEKPESKSSNKDGSGTLYCSFCGKSQHEVRKLIAGPTVFICDECTELCMDIIGKEKSVDFNSEYGSLSESEFTTAIYNEIPADIEPMKALYSIWEAFVGRARLGDIRAPRILLCGPMGCGKEYLFKEIVAMLDIPSYKFIASGLRSNSNFDQISPYLGLLQDADYNVEKCERGLLLIENLESLADRRVAENAIAQDELFTMLNLHTVQVQPQGGRRHPQQEFLRVRSRSISIIATCDLPYHYNPSSDEGWEIHPLASGCERLEDQIVACGYSQQLIQSFDQIVSFRLPNEDELTQFAMGPDFFRKALGGNDSKCSFLKLDETEARSLARSAVERKCGFASILSLGGVLALRSVFRSPSTETA